MKLEVLVSCMNQKDLSLVEKTKITSDVLLINQTVNVSDHVTVHRDGRTIRMISTKERGVSRSRNMAISHALGDICLLCDDDEILTKEYEIIVCNAFEELPQADIIIFDLEGNKKFRLKPILQRLGPLGCLKVVSYQIAFRTERIRSAGIFFDPFMGAGSGNGSGEENKFLLDCICKGLKIYYVPRTIGLVCHGPSTWFFGFDQAFFYQRGGATRHMMGVPLSVLYGIYYLIFKRRLYKDSLSTVKAAIALFKGIIENPIAKCKSGDV